MRTGLSGEVDAHVSQATACATPRPGRPSILPGHLSAGREPLREKATVVRVFWQFGAARRASRVIAGLAGIGALTGRGKRGEPTGSVAQGQHRLIHRTLLRPTPVSRTRTSDLVLDTADR